MHVTSGDVAQQKPIGSKPIPGRKAHGRSRISGTCCRYRGRSIVARRHRDIANAILADQSGADQCKRRASKNPADNWRPLIAIADCFGPCWSEAAREAAITFAHAYQDEDAGVVLLSDIRDIFNRTSAERMASVDLIAALLDVEESGWREYRGPHDDQTPRKLSQGEMARLLRPFGIRPRPIWPAAKRRKGTSRRGYYRAQFESAWARYCAEGVTASQPSNVAYIGNR